MRSQEDYLRDFAVLMTEKGVVAVSDPQQIAVYDFLCGGKKRPSDIAEALGLPSSSLHFILDKMVDSGIIVRSKPDPSRKEVYYSILALRIAGSTTPTPERIAESQETFSHLDSTHTGLASVAEMLESYLGEIGLDHDQLRTRYVKDLAAAFKDSIGSGSLESVMQSVKDCFHRLTGFRLSVFALNPPTIVFEGDCSMKSKMDMLSMLVKYLMENATGRTLAVRSVEDFSNQESARFKVVYDRADPEPEPYINTSLPQLAEPEKFFVVEIDGTVALIMNDIQNRLIDAIYERPLCVTDVVNAVNMPRSTVTTNLLRMVEEGVASVFYSESGAMYYGLSCSILMKRTRRASKDSTPTRNAIKLASKDGGFMEGYMLYLISSLQELGFDTDYMMVVLGAKYMRAAGQSGPKNFDSYFGTMSDIAKVVGLSLSVVSVYPLTIGISGSRDEQLSPAMTFVKGMAHQGLEMASSGIFVRVSEETPEDMKVSFKEIYPSLSADPAKVAEIAGVSDPAPVKKRTSSIRDALRNRSAKTDGRPVRSVRYITGIAMVMFAAMVAIMAMGGAVDDNTASAESYDLSVDPSADIVLYGPDGAEICMPFTVKTDETVTFRISSDCVPGVVKNGVAYTMEELYPLGSGSDSDGFYTIALEKDVTIVEVRPLSADLSALAVGIYDFGCDGSVGGVTASSFDRYISVEDYAGERSEIWTSGYAWVSLDAGTGKYLSFDDDSPVYSDHVCVGAWSEDAVVEKDIPDGAVTLKMAEGTVFEYGGIYYSGNVRVDKGEDISMKFVSTDGPVSILLDVEGSEQPVLMNRDRMVTLNLTSDAEISYVHVEFY